MSTGHIGRDGGLHPGRRARCRPCRQAVDKKKNARPHRAVYGSSKWRATRRVVLARDGYCCVRCGRYQAVLRPNERLVCDHYPLPLIELLERGLDPFDASRCRTLCSTCSGAVDGGRAARRRRTF